MPGYPLVMMVGMRILVIGSGGREHALVKGLSADPQSTEIHAAPGSAAMSTLATVHPEYSQVDDVDRMVELARDIAADLVVIGPEVPLVAGVADALRAAGIAVFGPSKEAAQIEGSKAFAKDVMEAAGVKTARAEQLRPGAAEEDIEAALDRFGPQFVVKDDGLAGGKGVVVTADRAAARAHVDSSMDLKFRFSAWLTARPSSRCCQLRTTSAPMTTTKAPIPAAWGRTPRCRGCRRRACSASWTRFASLWPRRWYAAAPHIPACFMPAWRGAKKARP